MSTLRTTKHFAQSGLNSICLITSDSPLEKEARAQGLNFVAIPAAGSRYFSISKSRLIRKTIKSNNASAIFLHNLRDVWLVRAALVGLTQVKLFGFTRMLLKKKKRDLLHTLLYRRFEKLITLTSAQQKLLSPYLPLSDEKYITIPNAVDTQRFSSANRSAELRAEWNATDSDFVIGLAGRLDQQKGQREFIEALALLPSDAPSWKAVLVGTDTANEEELGYGASLRARVRELGFSDRVTFTGYRSDMPQVMASLDAFIMPSYEEAFGNVLLEAMASGVPVLATSAGGAPEVLGDVGLLFPPRTSAPIADALMKLLTSPGLRADLSRRGSERVAKHFGTEAVREKLKQLL